MEEENWFLKLHNIQEQINKLSSVYNPDNDAFDEEAWNKDMNKLLEERNKLMKKK